MTGGAFSSQTLCRAGVFTALTCVLSQVAIPLPVTPVPLSLGLAAVFLSGLLLDAKTAALSQLCYLLLGAAGLPVFHHFQGGMGALFGPTGGYLLAYPVTALITALGAGSRGQLQGRRAVPAMAAGLGACYLGGTLWLSGVTGNAFSHCLALGVYPYLPLDALKIGLCLVVGRRLRTGLERTGCRGSRQ